MSEDKKINCDSSAYMYAVILIFKEFNSYDVYFISNTFEDALEYFNATNSNDTFTLCEKILVRFKNGILPDGLINENVLKHVVFSEI